MYCGLVHTQHSCLGPALKSGEHRAFKVFSLRVRTQAAVIIVHEKQGTLRMPSVGRWVQAIAVFRTDRNPASQPHGSMKARARRSAWDGRKTGYKILPQRLSHLQVHQSNKSS